MFSKIFIILFVLFCLPFNLKAQNYNFQKLNIQNGLPQSQVFAICFDSNDYAWIGTQGGGVAIYNGNEFKYITKQDSLVSNRVYNIIEINKQLWIACKGGVSVFNLQGEFVKNYRFKNPSTLATAIINFSHSIWIGTNGSGIYEIKNSNLTKYTANLKLVNANVNGFSISNSIIKVNTTKGIFDLKNTFNGLTKNKGLNSNYVTCSANYKQQRFIGMYDSGVQVYDKSKGIYTPELLKKIKNQIILDILVNQNEIWIATMNNGVFIWNKESNELKNFTVNNGLSNNHVRTLVKDKWGNIWIGTSGGGISIYNNSPFLEYNKTNGLNSNYIFDVIKTQNNDLWVSTQGNAVVRINDSSSVIFDEEFGYKTVKTKALFEDNKHNVWIGSEGEGLGVWLANDGKDTVYTFKNVNGLNSSWVKSFAQHPKTKQIFIGTALGIYYLTNPNTNPSKFIFKKVNNKNIPNRITQLKFSKTNQLYFSSDKGIGRVEQNTNTKKWVVMFLTNSDLKFRNICFKDSLLFGGSTDKGIIKININNPQKTEWISTKNWINSNNIYQLTIDKNNLWVGTEKGLSKLTFNTNNAIISTKNFGNEDGFEGVETNINASFKDHNNNLWFGTVNGLFLYNGSTVNTEKHNPPAFRLVDVQLFYESIKNTQYKRFFNHPNPDSVLTLLHNQNHIGFEIEALHYSYPKQIKYRWKLKGFDKDWTPPTKNTTATFGNLPAGNYTFLAQVSIDNTWQSKPLKYRFKIKAPYWKTLWFKTLIIVSVMFLLMFIIWLIYNSFKRKNQNLRNKLEMERSLLELEQKALRLQMNPHFIFNALNSIHNLIILNDSPKARYALSKFSKLMRMVLENSRQKLISIDDEVETLENYVQLEKLTTQNEFKFNINIDDNIDTNEPLLPPLMIQPFIENAIIHGLKNIMHEGEITVSFILINDTVLQCTIDDNGVGRANASLINAQKENYHKSTALQVTEERLSNINTKPNFKPFQIIDKIDDNGYGIGTTVIIQLEI